MGKQFKSDDTCIFKNYVEESGLQSTKGFQIKMRLNYFCAGQYLQILIFIMYVKWRRKKMGCNKGVPSLGILDLIISAVKNCHFSCPRFCMNVFMKM